MSFQALAFKTSKLYASDIIQQSYLATYAAHAPQELEKVLKPFKDMQEGRRPDKKDGKSLRSRFGRGV